VSLHITSLLHERNIAVGLEATTKEDALKSLIDMVGRSSRVLDVATVRDAVIEREAMSTTGIGEGIAIPHGKTAAVTDIVASFAVLKDPVDFQALDDQSVNVIFMLVGIESHVGTYLKLLSRARRLLSSASFRKKLLQCASSADVISAFREEEERYFHVHE